MIFSCVFSWICEAYRLCNSYQRLVYPSHCFAQSVLLNSSGGAVPVWLAALPCSGLGDRRRFHSARMASNGFRIFRVGFILVIWFLLKLTKRIAPLAIPLRAIPLNPWHFTAIVVPDSWSSYSPRNPDFPSDLSIYTDPVYIPVASSKSSLTHVLPLPGKLAKSRISNSCSCPILTRLSHSEINHQTVSIHLSVFFSQIIRLNVEKTQQKSYFGQMGRFDRNKIESGFICTVKNIHPAYQFTTPIITFRRWNYEFNLLFACSISLNLSFRSWLVTKSVIRVTNKTRKRSRWNIFVFFRKLPQDISYFHGCTTHARISIAAPLNRTHYAPLLFTFLFNTLFLGPKFTFDLTITSGYPYA